VVENLEALGFDYATVIKALNAADGNQERAANYLLGM
jgi:hypothetical protein